MKFTDFQMDYIANHGGVIDDDGHITITYKAFRKIGKDFACRDHVDRKRHVWLIPGSVLLIEGKHFSLVK